MPACVPMCDSLVVWCHPTSLCLPGLYTTGCMTSWYRMRPLLHLGRSCISWMGSWMGRWGYLEGAEEWSVQGRAG